MSGTRLVRLKPYDIEEGNVRQRYSVNLGGKDAAMFKHGNWYKVSEKMADYLAGIYQKKKKNSGKAFDICKDEAAAQEFLRLEREAAERGKRPEDAINMARDLTTADMPRPLPVAAADRASGKPQEPPEGDEEPEPPPAKKTAPKARKKPSKPKKKKVAKKKKTTRRK